MLDMHCHLIPNVDDGSKSMESSLAMLEEEIKQGVDHIIITPHYFHHRYETPISTIKAKFEELKEAAKAKGLQVDLRLGQEIMYSEHLDEVAMLEQGKILTMDNTKFILLEFNPKYAPESLSEALYNFNVHGYQVIVAHVERYQWMDKATIDTIINEGAYIQVNADSVCGKYGLKAKMFTHHLLKKGKVNFIASDMHYFRVNCMEEAHKKWGKYLVPVDIA